jgi:hypothetical protein
MKNILFTTLLSLTTSLFIGCGSSGGGSSDNKDNGVNDDTIKNDVILKKGDSIVCTTATSFSVEPTDKPLVNFSKDTESGEVTITLDKKSKGFVTIVGCTKK